MVFIGSKNLWKILMISKNYFSLYKILLIRRKIKIMIVLGVPKVLIEGVKLNLWVGGTIGEYASAKKPL